MSELRFTKLHKGLTLLLLVVFIVSVPVQSFAADVGRDGYYLNVTVDTGAFIFVSSVVHSDEWLDRNTPEVNSTKVEESEDLLESRFFNGKTPDFSNMPLTFPCENAAKQQDADAVANAQANLVPSLNELIYFIKDGSFGTYDEFVSFCFELYEALPNGGKVEGCTIKAGKDASTSREVKGKDGNLLDSTHYITVTNKKGTSRSFLYSIDKNSSSEKDVETVDLKIVMEEAFAHQVAGYTAKNAEDVKEPGVIEEAVQDLMQGLIMAISSGLGLFTIDELVFTGGIKASSLYLHGAIKNSWLPTINTIYTVFFVIALLSILFAIGKIILSKNISNAFGKEGSTILEAVKNLIVSGLLLIAMYPLFMLFLRFSYLLTDIFGNLAAPEVRGEFFRNLGSVGRGFLPIIVNVVYLIIDIYLNIYYTIREVLLSGLIASSPLFIMFYAFGEERQKAFTSWLKILLSTIFIQPIHAFVLGFLMSIPIGELRVMESLVFCACLVPVSEQFRKLIFQEADSIGSTTRQIQGNLATGAAATALASKKVSSAGTTVGSKVTQSRIIKRDPFIKETKEKANAKIDAAADKYYEGRHSVKEATLNAASDKWTAVRGKSPLESRRHRTAEAELKRSKANEQSASNHQSARPTSQNRTSSGTFSGDSRHHVQRPKSVSQVSGKKYPPRTV